MKPSLLKDIFQALDNRLSPPFRLDDLAQEIGYSKYHLCRAFHAATGEGLVTYLRRLTLSRSARSLRSGGRILDVAIAHGYQSQEAYHRAFAKMFGVTPLEFQKGHSHPSLLLKRSWNAEFMPQRTPETYQVTREAFTLWGMGGEYSYDHFDEIFSLWQRFHDVVPQSEDTYGVTFPLPSLPDHFRYYAAIARESERLALKTLTLPKQQYQVFVHHGPASTLMQTFNYIWGIWVPENDYVVTGIDFERYPAGFDPMDNNGEIEIYIPISRRD
ncbi:MAG: hypothetical protein C9356_13940 [Oleiphilus sp.]|nr:MAG: hypothetical protein C9356_13940 [Oleiphilus sp.]